MRRMSFHVTTRQMRERTKDVTRRQGWRNLRPGELVLAVDRIQRRRDQRVEFLGVIEVVAVRRERLDAITADEVAREGFPELTPGAFVRLFCEAMGADPAAEVARVEFRHVTGCADGRPKFAARGPWRPGEVVELVAALEGTPAPAAPPAQLGLFGPSTPEEHENHGRRHEDRMDH